MKKYNDKVRVISEFDNDGKLEIEPKIKIKEIIKRS